MTNPDELAAYAAEDLDHGPRVVRNTGTKLSRILWLGVQWASTEFGVERRDGGLRIPRDMLWDDEAGFGWIRCIEAVDDQADLEDFAEALRISRAIVAGRLNARAVRPSFAVAV
jgi:hypothetical protein